MPLVCLQMLVFDFSLDKLFLLSNIQFFSCYSYRQLNRHQNSLKIKYNS